jgi:hypothetical protein
MGHKQYLKPLISTLTRKKRILKLKNLIFIKKMEMKTVADEEEEGRLPRS